MNELLEHSSKTIDDKLDYISDVINEVFLRYQNKDKKDHILYVLKNTKLYFLDDTLSLNTPNRYFFNIMNLAKEIDQKYGLDYLTTSLYFMSRDIAFAKGVSLKIKNDDKIEKLYHRYQSTLDFLRMNKSALIDLINAKGEKITIDYLESAKVIQKKLVLSRAKGRFSSYIELARFNRIKPIFDSLKKKHSVHSLDDLMDFYSVLSALTIDSESFDVFQTKVYENFSRYSSKFNLDNCSQKELKGLKMKTEAILNNYLFKVLYHHPLIKDFNEQVSLANFDLGCLCDLVNVMSQVKHPSTNGISSLIRGNQVIMFKSSLLDKHPVSQNDAIFHEYIHAIECFHIGNHFYANEHYRSLNELSCELLSRECLGLCQTPLLEEHDNNQKIQLGYGSYEYVCKKLKETPFINDLILARINNDMIGLEKKYGKPLLKSIASLLDEPDSNKKEAHLASVLNTLKSKKRN